MKNLKKAWIVLGVIALVLCVCFLIMVYNDPSLTFICGVVLSSAIVISTIFWLCNDKNQKNGTVWIIVLTVVSVLAICGLASFCWIVLFFNPIMLIVPAMLLFSLIAWFLITCKLHKKRFT